MTAFQEITDLCHLSCSTTRVPWNSVTLPRNETALLDLYMTNVSENAASHLQQDHHIETEIHIQGSPPNNLFVRVLVPLYSITFSKFSYRSLCQVLSLNCIFMANASSQLALNKIGKECLMIHGTCCLNNVTTRKKI